MSSKDNNEKADYESDSESLWGLSNFEEGLLRLNNNYMACSFFFNLSYAEYSNRVIGKLCCSQGTSGKFDKRKWVYKKLHNGTRGVNKKKLNALNLMIFYWRKLVEAKAFEDREIKVYNSLYKEFDKIKYVFNWLLVFIF